MDTIRINVPLTMAEAQQLIALAKRERRHPREQAAYFIVEKLRESGALPNDTRSAGAERARKQEATIQ